MDFFATGAPVVNDGVDDHAGGLNSDTFINDDDSEVVAMIKEVCPSPSTALTFV